MSTICRPTFADTGGNRGVPTRVVAIVRGTGDVLLEAVVRYSGIRVLSYRTNTDSALCTPFTVAVLEVNDISTLHRWYADDAGVAPFPDGALLYWRFIG